MPRSVFDHMSLGSVGKVAVLSTLAGLALSWFGVHELRVGLAARSGPTPTACDGPVTAAYLELRDCYLDFRDAVPHYSDERELTVIYVPIRSSLEQEATIVVRLRRSDPMFHAAEQVIRALKDREVPREQAVGSLTTIAEISDYRPDKTIRSKLWARRTSEEVDFIDPVTEKPTTPWVALLELGGALLGLVAGVFAWIPTIRGFKQDLERLRSDEEPWAGR